MYQDGEFQLSAVVRECDGGFEAQLIEIDIAARSTSIDSLLLELAHAISATCEIAREVGQTPFVDILRPAKFSGYGRGGQSEQIGVISLDDRVAEALAAALRLRSPVRRIPVYNRIAA